MTITAPLDWLNKVCDFSSFTGECKFPFELSEGVPLSIPTVVALLVVALVLFFLFAVFRLYQCQSHFQGNLKKHIDLLKKEQVTAGGLGRAALNRVGEFLRQDPLCAHGWKEFTETIVSEGQGGEERIYNTRQAREFFSEEELVEESMHPAFFRSVPGVLTSLGLLGTFIAILLGLAVIHIPEGAGTGQITGIGQFVNALSGKFLSSVFALALAIVFTLMESRILHRAYQTYRKFCQSFDAVFPRRTAEEVLMAMNRELQGQRAAFEHFNTDLSNRFRDGIAEGLGPILQNVADGLESFSGERDSNIEALLSRFTTEFRNSMTQSAGTEFTQIATTLEQASELMGHANEQTETTRASFEALVGAMEQSRAAQEELSGKQATTMNEILERMASTISEVSTNSQSAVDSTIREIMERASLESREQAGALRETLEQYSESINQKVGALCSRVEDAASKMASAGASGSRDLEESIRKVTERLEQTTSSFVEQSGRSSERIVGELSMVLEEHRSNVGSFSGAREALERTLVVWNKSTEEMRLAVTPLRDASSQLETAASSLKGVAAEVREAQQRVGEMLGRAKAELERLASMEATSQRVLGEYERVFETLQSGLAGTLTTITEKMETLQAVSARGLTSQLQEFDNHLGTATQKLGAAIDELGEVLEGAAETIANSAAPR